MSEKQLLHSFVIETNPTGESDLLVTLLTLELGKIRCIAKGARKSKKRFMNVLDPFANIDAVVRTPTKTGLFFLENGWLKRGLESVRKDYSRFILASLCLELVDLWCREHQAEKEIYQLLSWYLESIEVGRDFLLCTLIFETRLLKACGFMPSLKACHGCKKELSGKHFGYEASTGQVFCKDCGNEKPGRSLGISAIKSMDFWLAQPLAKVLRLRVSGEIMSQVWTYLRRVHTNCLEREPNAYRFTRNLLPPHEEAV